MNSERVKFSIVVPIYFNEPNIPHTIPRLQRLEQVIPNCDFEYVFVDDGSKDKSLQLLIEAREKDQRIKVIKLSKNFGSMSAIQAGLKYATGDCVGIIAADLQDPPELFEKMLEYWKSGKKVVLGTRSDREESISQKIFSNTYYYLLRKFALKGYPEGGFDFLLVDRQVVNEILEIREKNTNIMSLIYWLGHEREYIPYVRQERKLGKSRWTLSKKIKLFIDSFVSFSYTPIRFMSLIGVLTAVLSFIYGVFVVVSTLFGIIELQGWTTIISLITFLLGIIMIMLGIIGEYLWRILDESRDRPSYVVDETFE
ncbi:glycosyltransferase family 2 protein [Paenibacillus sp. Y412MC10]|uniref:glycosyltransferase family 2 protein n=1 Tax=Geobacillus sp. (strain Y412MC10) TaxID=481743 RepID=UPI00017890F7|nr:glycosyltransferase family 2 protein [Paenibacillus sp. Y412MC10]ACX68015.1 glycosyl transferase family 2 [Paenibacillus sp. Y412MC10]